MIVERFKSIVEKYSDRHAVCFENTTYTYKELDEYSNYIANKLLQIGKPGMRVAITLDRSFDLIAAVIGTLKSGMIYVPIDNTYPIKRIEYMLISSKIEITISKEQHKRLSDENTLILQSVQYDVKMHYSVSKEEKKYAYIIFTSGSTGKPKGVLVSNESIMNTLEWRIRYYSVGCNDVVLQIPSFSFSSSVEDIFTTLLSGGMLIMIRQADLINMRKIGEIVYEKKVSHMLLVPSLYYEMMPYIRRNFLRFVVVAGEAITTKVIKRHYDFFPRIQLYNEYGMSETSVAFSACLVTKNETRCIIGKPIDNMSYRLENIEDGIGELIISGIGVASGYINQEENEKTKFDLSDGSIRLFKTGDYVKVDKDNLIYYGREDDQVKLYGKRFSLSEINRIIRESQNITEVISTFEHGKINCYIEDKEEIFDEKKVVQALKENIPKEFIPKKFTVKRKFERLPNGKVDKQKIKM